MKDFGYGEEYCYVYDELGVYVVGECYFLLEMSGICYYQFILCGLEIKIVEKLVYLVDLNVKSL